MFIKAIALSGLLISLSANAAIIDLGNITRDTVTGLDWLDVTESRGLSYDEVLAQTGVGGDYEGWRHATAAELDQLILNFGYVAVNSSCDYGVMYCDTGISGDSLLVEQMIKMLGDTWHEYQDNYEYSGLDYGDDGAGATVGWLAENYSDPDNQDARTLAKISDMEHLSRSTGEPLSDSDDSVETVFRPLNKSFAGIDSGSFLVRTTVVPVPAAAWLFGSALIGLLGIKRKK